MLTSTLVGRLGPTKPEDLCARKNRGAAERYSAASVRGSFLVDRVADNPEFLFTHFAEKEISLADFLV